MKIIIITGPSGSGKTFLSNKLAKIFDNSIVVKTDSYYRDDFIIKILSLFAHDIYDRFISIKNKEIIKTISSIYKKEKYTSFYNYDFSRKISSKSTSQIKYRNNNGFIILEGIFAHRLDLNYNESINILCKENKEICYQRRLKRDQKERNRNKKEVNKKFNKSWNLYFRNLNRYINSNEVISINISDKNCYEKLINKLKIISLNK
tara:strand:- start:88 stop:702 length:615 start_codon:yes stop_codon:yes gene_type:complete